MPNTRLRRGLQRHLRPFLVTGLVLSALTAYSLLVRHSHGPLAAANAVDHAAAHATRRAEPACSELHSVSDQCAFVKRHCADANAGLLPYLELYYCTPQGVRPLAFALLVVWLGLLFTTIGIAASDFFSVNLGTISSALGLSESLAGVTFLALGNGSPDVFSTFAAMSSNSPSMAVGELIGAASFITGVVAGSMALVREFRVDRETYTRDICFFIVAVAFTMAFLADGRLRFWECCAMVGYYVLYVMTVVGCHWHAVRKRRRLRREGEARSQYYAVDGHAGDELAGEPYRDDPEDVGRAPSRAPTLGDAPSACSIHMDLMDGDHERMVAAEVTRNMRIVRTGAKRHNSLTPIRPSLVGALEFRSALAQLRRESTLLLPPVLARGNSESHFDARARRGTTCNALHGIGSTPDPGTALIRRDRALSSNDIPTTSATAPDLLPGRQARPRSSFLLPEAAEVERTSPTLTPPRPIREDDVPTVSDSGLAREPIPKLRLDIPSQHSSQSAGSSPCTAFPRYADSAMALTPNALSEQAARLDGYSHDLQAPAPGPAPGPAPVRWWPSSVLPPPHVLLATLFPTLQGWREKSHWDRFLGAISVPSIFLLVITLPVVDSEASEEGAEEGAEEATPAQERVVEGAIEGVTPAISVIPAETQPAVGWEGYCMSAPRGDGSRAPAAAQRRETAVDATDHLTVGEAALPVKPAPDGPKVSEANDEAQPWNRWLLCLQLFTGPLFAVLILWANLREDMGQPGRELARMVLCSLLVSLVLLGVVLATTTEQRRPRFHYLFCFLGFVISVAWISTIASEVVGVLKAFGVVLGISEALLGLTVFAAGNSIGDLVADITVARLGYPVMALSACFGGPMLNILLGIGIGGVMMMIKQANGERAKHPDRPVRYGPYRVRLGGTLLVSSVTLLLMLVLLVVLVPLNKWVLSRRIGWAVMTLWTLSTVVSVALEVTGMGGEAA